jgi:large subunit ribosomal protein L5
MTILQEKYHKEVVPALIKQFKYNNINEVPKLVKVVLNMGVGEAVSDHKIIENAVSDLTRISGQKPVITPARNDISGFKLRAGAPIGCKVTLRRAMMYEFLERLFFIALARVRDFRGTNPNSFDGRGNYALGIKEQIIFPEIDYDKIDKVRGLDIIINTTAKTNEEGKVLLQALGMPFSE